MDKGREMVLAFNTIYNNDCMAGLKQLPDRVVNCCVTSPPYWGLRDYGVDGQLGLEPTPEEYTAKMVEVFREVRRVLRDDGTLWLNLGDSYAGSGRGADAIYANQKLSTDSLRIKPDWAISGLKPKDLVGVPWRVAFALQADGWYLRSDIIWSKKNPMPESVTDRPTKAHEYIFLMSKSQKYYYDAEAIKETAVNGDPNPPRGSRGVLGNQNNGRRKQDEVGKRTYTGFNGRYQPLEKRNKRTVWTVSTHPFPEAHFATFPEKLIEPCILAGCPEKGIVLDPFMGSGTTAIVAHRLGRQFIGFELNPEYCEMANRRIKPLLMQQRFEFGCAGVGEKTVG
jgi:DNA modification methylase